LPTRVWLSHTHESLMAPAITKVPEQSIESIKRLGSSISDCFSINDLNYSDLNTP
jgi:hypothetical protein